MVLSTGIVDNTQTTLFSTRVVTRRQSQTTPNRQLAKTNKKITTGCTPVVRATYDLSEQEHQLMQELAETTQACVALA
jgi:hypothetical protein